MSALRRIVPWAAISLLTACVSPGPDYRRPALMMPEVFEKAAPWKVAAPGDLAARGPWWQVFGDPVLDDLEARARRQSPTLAAFAARVDQARAIAGIAGSFQYPEIGVAAAAGRFRGSGNRPDQPDKRPGNREFESNVFRVPLTVAYEIDLWGRVRRLAESARAQADAASAEYQTVALTLEADIAVQYFRLRQADEERRILGRSIALQQRARQLVAARWQGGLATELDVVRLDGELALTEAAAEDASRRREDLELALAALVGTLPEGFRIAEAPPAFRAPAVPVGLPADLLERRPDIAEAELRLVARNAEIGASRAAYFPAIRLTGSLGFESHELAAILDQDSLIWSLGASLFQPIFNAGRIGFDVIRAKAAHAEALAVYRGRLVRAFREVEGALAALRSLDDQSRFQNRAEASAARSVRIANARYRAGLVTVLELIDAQRTHLRAERESLAVRSQQATATVGLIKSLGGGWGARQALAAAPQSRVH